MTDVTMVDAFSHIIPPGYLAHAEALGPSTYLAAARSRPTICDIGTRLRLMDDFPGYVQILTLGAPPIETLGNGGQTVVLAQRANDEMAELCRRHPERFVGFAAALPLDQPERALVEFERAVNELGALGVQIHTNVRGSAWDEPRFAEFWEAADRFDRPLWVHPFRSIDVPDYAAELESRHGIFLALGWPYETSLFMTRLVFSGILERHPGLRILTHHAGGLVPHFAQRVGWQVGQLPEQWPQEADAISERAGTLYRRFFGDTALDGYLPALRCGLSFFGADRLLFGTDMPYGQEQGAAFIRGTIQTVQDLDVSHAERQMIFRDNAVRVLGVRLPA